MTSVPDTLLINGQDLRSAFTGITIYGVMNLFAPGLRRGADDVLPGRRGQFPVPGLPLDAYNFSVFIFVKGTTRGARNAHLLGLTSTLVGTGSDGLVSLTRRLANAADTGYDEYTAQGRFNSGLAMQTLNHRMGTCELQFANLDGGWTRTSDNAFVIP